MKKLALLIFMIIAFGMESTAQSVFSPNDPMIDYDVNNPPPVPAWDVVAKWVRTPRLNWDTDAYKAYYFNGFSFRLRFPEDYDPSGSKKYPLIIMFHGRGESGTIYDNEYQMRHGGRNHEAAVKSKDFDGFVMFPQNQSGFWGNGTFKNIDKLIRDKFPEINVDPNQVHVHGLSAGGAAVHRMISLYPSTFASAIPMSAASELFISNISQIQYIKIWQSQGALDKNPAPGTTQTMVDAMLAAGMDVTYTIYPHLGHAIWNTHYREPDFFPFFNRANRVNPHVFFGRTEFCSEAEVNTKMGVAAGFEAYEWRKDGLLIPSATSNEYIATSFGTYDVRFKINGEWSYWSPSPVTIQQKTATVVPPIQISGLRSKVIPAPDDNTSVLLEIPDNDYVAYAWKRLGASTILSTDRIFEASSSGQYTVSVTERFGCTSGESAPFAVVSASGPNAPSPIIGLTAIQKSQTEIELRWGDNINATNNETAFEVYRGDRTGGPYVLVGLTGADVLRYVDRNLTADTDYYYIVRAVNETGASTVSSEATASTSVDDIAPEVVQNVRIPNKTANSMTIEWDESSDNVGVEKYEVYRNGVKSAVVSGTSAILYNLTRQVPYTIYVVARDKAGNVSAPSDVVTDYPSESGLSYKYYHGRWSALPDFNSISPIKEGFVKNIDLSLRERNTEYAFFWEGSIHVPVTGNYTFETRSDDGSKLYIDSYDESNLVVNNDGLHGRQFREGTIFLEAGAHPIVITYLQRGGGASMEVYWKNTAHGITDRQLIPDEAFNDVYEPVEDLSPATSSLTAEAVSLSQIDLSWLDNSSDERAFQIFRAEAGERQFVPLTIVPAGTTSYQDKGLMPNTTYFYKIRALKRAGATAFSGAVGSRGLWLFNNDLSDISGYDVATTSTGSFTYDATDKIEGSHSVVFNGTDNSIVWGELESYFRNAFNEKTIAFWFKATDTSTDRMLFEQGGSSSGIAIKINNNRLEAVAANGGVKVTTSTSFSSTDWNHFAISFDNGLFKMYLNGALVDTGTASYATIPSHDIRGGIGASISSNTFGTASAPFEGKMDALGVYQTALSDSNIQDLASENTVSPRATTFAPPSTPSFPKSLSANALSTTEIVLSWEDDSNNEDGFEVYRSINVNNNFLPVATLPAASGGTLQFVDKDLFPNIKYYYNVKAVNEGGKSTSNYANATTLNNKPELGDIEDFTMKDGTVLSLPLSAEDIDGGTLTYTVSNLPGFAVLTDNGDGTADIAFSPSVSDLGVYSNITIEVSDPNGGVDTEVFNLIVNDNNLPLIKISGAASASLTEEETATIELQASDIDGTTDLVWTTEGLPSFATLGSNPDGSATLEFVPDYSSNGTYEIEVTVTDPAGAKARKTVSVNIEDVNPNFELYVNVTQDARGAAPWNNIKPPISTIDLLDSEGSSSGVTIDFLTTWWKTWRAGAVTGNNSGVFEDNVLKDYLYFGFFGGPNVVQFRVAGLDPNKPYKFSFLGSSTWDGIPDNGSTVYEINGVSETLYVQNNSRNLAVLSDVQADASGEVVVTMSKSPGTRVGYLNAFTITSIADEDKVPAAPRELSADISHNQVALSWIDAPYNETGFEVFRSESLSGTYDLLGTVDADVTTFSDGAIEEGKTYFYKVNAVNAVGSSEDSNIAELLIPNTAPLISSIANIKAVEGKTTTVSITAVDAPSNNITFAIMGLPAFASFSDLGGGNATITLSPEMEDIGTYEGVELEATDADGASSTTSFDIVVTEDLLYTVSVNFTRNTQAPSPWNNTNSSPIINSVFTDLKDGEGNNSGIRLTLLTQFGGVVSNGTVTGDDSGVVPDNVSKEYYWFGLFGAAPSVRIRVAGLNPRNVYNFKFLGSTTFTTGAILDNGATVYQVGNNAVSLSVQNNTTDLAVLRGINPSSRGEVILEISKDLAAKQGVLNALIIEAVAADKNRYNPRDLGAVAASSSAIGLSWVDNSSVEYGFEIQRSTTGEEGSYTSIHTTGPNESAYLDTGLEQNTIYYYKVRAMIPLSAPSGFSNIAQTGTVAYSVFVNINGSPAYDAPVPWNNLSQAPSDGDTFVGFRNSDNIESGIAIEFDKAMQGSNAWGVSTGDDSGVFPDRVMESFFFNDAFDQPGQLTIMGLDQSYRYNFTFFSSIVTTNQEINTNYTINGEKVTNRADNNSQNTASISGISPNEDNEVNITVQEAPGSRWAIWNAMLIEATPSEASVLAGARRGTGLDLSRLDNVKRVNFGIQKKAQEFSIYPVPSNGEFNLQFGEATEGRLTVEVIDMMGKLVYVKDMENTADGHYRINANSANIQNGVYIVKATFEDGSNSIAKLYVE